MTKSLTEQWKDGTLESGMYYWQLSNNETFMATLYKMDEYKQTKDASKIICLAPVPSYDEFKQLVSKIEQLMQKIHILNEQNTKQYNELCEEIKKNNTLEKRLEIATKALKKIERIKVGKENNFSIIIAYSYSSEALKEMKGVK